MINANTKNARCRIFEDWIDLLQPLQRTNPIKWSMFFCGIVGFALGAENAPDFSQDSDLSELWEQTTIIPYNADTDKEGCIKVNTREGGQSDE